MEKAVGQYRLRNKDKNMVKEGMEKLERWKNFEQWKKELIHDFDATIRGCEDEEMYYEISSRCLQEILFCFFSPNESQADVLFSLFTDEVDHWMFDRVITQLDCMKDKDIFVKCLLKAFPRLSIKAKKWAKAFLYSFDNKFDADSILLGKLLKSNDIIGKQSIVNFIDKFCSDAPHEYYMENENAVQSHLEDSKDFKKLAIKIEASMK